MACSPSTGAVGPTGAAAPRRARTAKLTPSHHHPACPVPPSPRPRPIRVPVSVPNASTHRALSPHDACYSVSRDPRLSQHRARGRRPGNHDGCRGPAMLMIPMETLCPHRAKSTSSRRSPSRFWSLAPSLEATAVAATFATTSSVALDSVPNTPTLPEV